jgi:RNA polymerase sigma-70 factor (ECF subfamily)
VEDEIKVIKKCQDGDKEMFALIFENYKNFVYNISFQFFNNKEDAEDLTQDVFVRLFLKIKSFKFKSSFKTFLTKITINLAKDRIRRKKIIKFEKLPENISLQKENDEILEKIKESLNSLPEKYKTVIILKDCEGFSIKETCEILNKKEGTVKSLIFRGREILRDKLKNE